MWPYSFQMHSSYFYMDFTVRVSRTFWLCLSGGFFVLSVSALMLCGRDNLEPYAVGEQLLILTQRTHRTFYQTWLSASMSLLHQDSFGWVGTGWWVYWDRVPMFTYMRVQPRFYFYVFLVDIHNLDLGAHVGRRTRISPFNCFISSVSWCTPMLQMKAVGPRGKGVD